MERSRFRFPFGTAAGQRALWVPLILLLLAVLVPTAALLYLINEAIDQQRNLARQEIGTAYRGQLAMVRDRIENFWQDRVSQLDARSPADEPGLYFEHCVRDGLADSVIVLNADGSPAYPALPAPPRADPTLHSPGWIEARKLEDAGRLEEAGAKYEALARDQDPSTAARAKQSAIRCLVRRGKSQAAIDAIEDHLSELGSTLATGLDGRIIGEDELVLALQLLRPGSRDFVNQATRLHSRLQNYQHSMPASQRLFLMDQMRALSAEPRFHAFITYGAERLAERVLSAGKAVPGDAALRQTGIADTWAITTPGRKVIALYYDSNALSRMLLSHLGLNDPGRGATFWLIPPGAAVNVLTDENGTRRATRVPAGVTTILGNERIAAGAHLPGWQIALTVIGPVSDEVNAKRRIAVYSWLGFLTIGVMAVLAALAGSFFRRQMRVASLKTDLVAAVSHELKTPLASMKLLVESLLSSETLDPKRARHYLQLVANENSRLSRLIDNFLTFSRMEQNRGKFEFARIRPEAVVQAAIDSIGERFHVDVSVADGLPLLYADEDALVTVLLNLLDNAYKYTGDARRIGLNVSLRDRRVCFAVSDNGIGISPREQKKIFRRFYQVDRRLARSSGGVGLGLSIVEFVVQAHGGTVTVESRLGAGSTFTVSLPPSVSAAGAAA